MKPVLSIIDFKGAAGGRRRCRVSMLIVCLFLLLPSLVAQQYDIVLQGGRVIDPESNLDAVRNVGISGNTVRAITQDRDNRPHRNRRAWPDCRAWLHRSALARAEPRKRSGSRDGRSDNGA